MEGKSMKRKTTRSLIVFLRIMMHLYKRWETRIKVKIFCLQTTRDGKRWQKLASMKQRYTWTKNEVYYNVLLFIWSDARTWVVLNSYWTSSTEGMYKIVRPAIGDALRYELYNLFSWQSLFCFVFWVTFLGKV